MLPSANTIPSSVSKKTVCTPRTQTVPYERHPFQPAASPHESIPTAIIGQGSRTPSRTTTESSIVKQEASGSASGNPPDQGISTHATNVTECHIPTTLTHYLTQLLPVGIRIDSVTTSTTSDVTTARRNNSRPNQPGHYVLVAERQTPHYSVPVSEPPAADKSISRSIEDAASSYTQAPER